MHEYVTFPDETMVAYSDMLDDGTIEILAERPTEEGFDSARFSLPSITMMSHSGFGEGELRKLSAFLARHNAIITRLASEPERRYA